jgi:hypothetical protein
MALFGGLQFPNVVRGSDEEAALQAPGFNQCWIEGRDGMSYRKVEEGHTSASAEKRYKWCDAECCLVAQCVV